MHVDGELVGHADADRAERIARPGILPQRVIGRPFRAPVDGARIDLLARAVENADLGARQVAGVALHSGNDFLLDDRGRDRPGRVEVDDLDMGRDLGRRMLGIADDRDIAVNDAAVLDRLDRGRGQVDDDIAIVEGKIEPGQTIGAGGKLVEAHRRRNVDRFQRRAGDDAGLTQSHARLEALHRRRQARRPTPGRSPCLRPDRPRSPGACAS